MLKLEPFLKLESETVARSSMMPSLSAYESAGAVHHNKSKFGSPQ